MTPPLGLTRPAYSVPPFAAIAGADGEAVAVDAHARERAEPGRPRGLVLREGARARLQHRILADRVEAPRAARVIEPDVADVVVPELHADDVLRRPSGPAPSRRWLSSRAGDERGDRSDWN